MRIFTFASRNTKEITRDILTLIFGIAFPIVLLLLLSAVLSAVWAFVYASLFSSERYYISSIPLVLILCIVTNPDIFEGVPLGRMLTMLGRVFPAWVVRL